MKTVFKYLLWAVCVLLAVSCAREPAPVEPQEMIPVQLGLNLPVADATRTVVSGTNVDEVTSVWLLCFNELHSYLGKFPATLTPAGGGSSGLIHSEIPLTSRYVHFIANKNLSAFTTSYSQEQLVLTEGALVSTVSDPVAFWAYYSCGTAAELKGFMNASPTPSTIYFLRDRAKVTIDISSASMTANNIVSIQWTTSGISQGYTVPYPFENYYDPVNFYGTSTLTPYMKSDVTRYTANEANLVPMDQPMYLFEDINSFENRESFVKMILKVTYSGSVVRYHNLLLIDDNYIPLTIIRGHHYKFTITSLPSDTGYTSFADALAGEVYTNNQTVAVDRSITTITDGDYFLNITDPAGTSILYQEGGAKIIPFTFLDKYGNPESGRTSADFHLMWLEHDGTLTNRNSEPEPVLSYDPATGSGTIGITLNPVGSNLGWGLLLLQDLKYGLSRYIEVYTKDQFTFSGDVIFEKVAGTTHQGHAVYHLGFVLPEELPASFYPIKVSMATVTLNPFSDTSAGSTHGVFSVEVRDTDILGSGNEESTEWDYHPNTWDYWFTYSIPSPASRTVDIYFEDVTYKWGNEFVSVGLYFSLPYFGAPRRRGIKVE